MNPHDDFDTLLLARHFTPASAGLAGRIAQRARHMPQRMNVTAWEWFRGLFAEFLSPQPAYALSGVVALGLLLGIVLSPSLDNQTEYLDDENTELTEIASFMYMEESL